MICSMNRKWSYSNLLLALKFRKGTIVADTFAQRLVVTNDCSESLKVAVRKCLPRLISWWFLPVNVNYPDFLRKFGAHFLTM